MERKCQQFIMVSKMKEVVPQWALNAGNDFFLLKSISFDQKR